MVRVGVDLKDHLDPIPHGVNPFMLNMNEYKIGNISSEKKCATDIQNRHKFVQEIHLTSANKILINLKLNTLFACLGEGVFIRYSVMPLKALHSSWTI